jgi:hypothetical protein
MNTRISFTKQTQPPMPAGFAVPGKLTLTLTLAVSFAGSIWSQTAPAPGPHPRPLTLSTTASSLSHSAENTPTDHFKFIEIQIKGATSTNANGIANDGLVTGYYLDAKSIYHGFVWRDGRVETVDYPGASGTFLFGVNNRGLAIGYYIEGAVNHAVTYSIWSRTWTALPDIANYPLNQGYGINDSGIAVGNAFSSTASVAWIYDPATLSYSEFTVPGAAAYTTSPSGLNDEGQIAGYFADASGVYHGFIKEYGTYTTIDAPGAPYTFLDGINNSGVIQGQIYNAAFFAQGFTATSGGLFDIVNYPGPMMTAIVGINDHGDLCGSYWQTFGINTAFVAFRSDRVTGDPGCPNCTPQ